MLIEEDKVIELEDGTRHLLVKKVRCDDAPYMICLALTGEPVLEVFRFGEDNVYLEIEPGIIKHVLDTYLNSDAYKEDLQKTDVAYESYEKAIKSGEAGEGSAGAE